VHWVAPHLHSPLSHVLPVGHGAGYTPHVHAWLVQVSDVPLHGSAEPHLQAPAVHRSAVVLEQPAEQALPSTCAQLGKVPWITQWPVLPSQQPPPESPAHLVESHSQTSGSSAVLHA